LPDDVTWNDLIYAAYVHQKIDAGVQVADAWRVVPPDEVKKKFLA